MTIGSKYDGSTSFLQGRLDDIRVRKGTGESANFANPRVSSKIITDLARWCKGNDYESIDAIKGLAHTS